MLNCHNVITTIRISAFQSKLATDLLKTRPNAKSDVDENGLDVLLSDLAEDLWEAAHRLQSDHVVDVVLVVHAGHHRRQNHRTELLYLPRTTANQHRQHLAEWNQLPTRWTTTTVTSYGFCLTILVFHYTSYKKYCRKYDWDSSGT